jgi:chaperone modulatory protein CbpM
MPTNQLVLHCTAGGHLTLSMLADEARLHPRFIEQLVDFGLLEPGREKLFDRKALRRLRSICRLHDDLGINLAGIAVALDLLERIQSLQRELANVKGRAAGNRNT